MLSCVFLRLSLRRGYKIAAPLARHVPEEVSQKAGAGSAKTYALCYHDRASSSSAAIVQENLTHATAPILLLLICLLLNCGQGGAPVSRLQCAGDGDCPSTEVCVAGRCVDTDATAADGTTLIEDATDLEDDGPTSVLDGSGVVGEPHEALCRPCVGDSDCRGGVCIELADLSVCVTHCRDEPCPRGFRCLTQYIDGATGELCLPTSGTCEACVDADGDGYGFGHSCDGHDCDDTRTDVHQSAAEFCDDVDNDCDGRTDEDFLLQSDDANCGACGRVCRFDNAESTCEAGRCVITDCLGRFADCDLEVDNGCETPDLDLNLCRGCVPLAGVPGDVCGSCETGHWACDGVDAVECIDDEGEAVMNVCGGCSELAETVGGPCGVCGSGVWACSGLEDVACAGDLGEGWYECGVSCCRDEQVCHFELCIDDVACAGESDCQDDRYCDPDLELCFPYDDGPRGDHDSECRRLITISRFSPELQCAWERPPDGDAHPAWRHVLTTPVVVDFDFDDDAELVRPSVVFTSDDGSDGGSEQATGLIRIIDGRTCTQQYTLEMQWTSHSSPPAVGDLNDDGRPDIVAYMADGGLVAFSYDLDEDAWGVLWRSHFPDGSNWQRTGGGWGGPAIHDLDNDGVPEVLRGGTVFAADGALLDDTVGYLTHHTAPANMSFVVDVDNDGQVELVSGDGLWGWDTAASTWVEEPYFSVSGLNRGHVAVGNLGDFPMDAVDYPLAPEVVVIWSGQVRVQTLEGTVVFGPLRLPGSEDGGEGGPPTIGDFDGDGRAEIAAASKGAYTVFDLDCTAGAPVGTCETGRTDGVLWTRVSQDYSSSSTGSSVFDFEGDGKAEAIYADECFVRVYDGASGEVVFSQFRSSCTWHENPIVADVDGDFNSELVVPSNMNCGVEGKPCYDLDPGDLDPQFPGIICVENEDCRSGSCIAGYCRCSTSADCCSGDCEDAGFVCAEPPLGTPGTGNTCRAGHPTGTAGIRIYRDALDRWVNSRPIWNQHAYFVTNVHNGGQIPRTSDALRNWEVEGLNNFRQNVQGDREELNAPDLTSRAGAVGLYYCDPADGSVWLAALVCNRGTEPVDSDLVVGFFDGPADGGDSACRALTTTQLDPGECERVGCFWHDPPPDPPGRDVTVVPDPDNSNSECHEGNNTSVIAGVHCP